MNENIRIIRKVHAYALVSDFCEALCAGGAMDIKPDFLNRGCWKTVKAAEINVIAQRSSLLMSQAWFRGRVG